MGREHQSTRNAEFTWPLMHRKTSGSTSNERRSPCHARRARAAGFSPSSVLHITVIDGFLHWTHVFVSEPGQEPDARAEHRARWTTEPHSNRRAPFREWRLAEAAVPRRIRDRRLRVRLFLGC